MVVTRSQTILQEKKLQELRRSLRSFQRDLDHFLENFTLETSSARFRLACAIKDLQYPPPEWFHQYKPDYIFEYILREDLPKIKSFFLHDMEYLINLFQDIVVNFNSTFSTFPKVYIRLENREEKVEK